MAHAAVLTGGFPVLLIKVATAFFSFPWRIRQPHGCPGLGLELTGERCFRFIAGGSKRQ